MLQLPDMKLALLEVCATKAFDGFQTLGPPNSLQAAPTSCTKPSIANACSRVKQKSRKERHLSQTRAQRNEFFSFGFPLFSNPVNRTSSHQDTASKRLGPHRSNRWPESPRRAAFPDGEARGLREAPGRRSGGWGVGGGFSWGVGGYFDTNSDKGL